MTENRREGYRSAQRKERDRERSRQRARRIVPEYEPRPSEVFDYDKALALMHATLDFDGEGSC